LDGIHFAAIKLNNNISLWFRTFCVETHQAFFLSNALSNEDIEFTLNAFEETIGEISIKNVSIVPFLIDN